MSSKSCQKYRPLLNSLEIISIKQQNVYSTTLLRHSLLINSFHMQSFWIKCSQFVHPEVLTFFLVVWITEIYNLYHHVLIWAIMAMIKKMFNQLFLKESSSTFPIQFQVWLILIEARLELCDCWASILLFAHFTCNQVNNA